MEALVKFPNPKIAESTVREMQEKCLIMGDRYMMDCTRQWQYV
jgi:hypothetical protein